MNPQRNVLFGGRPLPPRPLWLRVLIIAVVLSVTAPIIKLAFAALLDRFHKLSAEEVEVRLASQTGIGPHRDVQCEPNRGWDYVCTFLSRPVDPQAVNADAQLTAKRLKVGVQVGNGSIKYVSHAYDLDARVIRR